MSSSDPQPDHNADPIIQEFHEWVSKNCKLGMNGLSSDLSCPFMPLPDLKKYLKAEKRTTRLLRALYPDREHWDIELLENWYIRVFAILILIGKGRYIEHIVQHRNLRDDKLPFLEKPSHFPVDPDHPSFWDLFKEKQFIFCAQEFRYYENNQRLEDHCILPITSKEVLDQGGSAAIYKIKLHPHYDQLNPVGEASRAFRTRPANTYVLKTYNTKDASSYYTNEVNAFMKLTTKRKIDEHLIQFLGSYKQGDTYNILLEYADRGTLGDFFKENIPPSLGEDILIFWRRLFNIIKALRRIHATARPDGFRGPDILIGWHQDVKPKNILVLSGKSDHRYDVEFKLGDLGLSHFKRTVKLDRRIVKADIGGTKDYGAPECFRGDDSLEHIELKVKPLIDIWSFGGVCSEAAVWVVLGKAGLNEYRLQREREIRAKRTSQDGRCFHDGEKILETVKNMHDRLLKQGEIRPSDHVTGPVLDQMVVYMLEEDPDGRNDANWHHKKGERILKAAKEKLSSPSFDPKLPMAPVQNPNKAGQYLQSVTHPHGPPPNLPRYSPTPGIRRYSTNQGEASQNSPPETPTYSPMATTTDAVGSAELAARTKKPEIPYLSFTDAKRLRDSRRALLPEDENLLNDLKCRDHVFLIDDSGSMKRRWHDVITFFSVFSYITKKHDSNGQEIYFTVSTNHVTFKKTKKAVSHLENMNPSSFSNIDQSLEHILGRYREKLDLQRRFSLFKAAVKPLSLYVLTDAAWQGDAIEPIERMIDFQRAYKLPREQVGIQFIRFGNDPEGIQKLEYLDSGLRKKHTKKWDIVDTEPFQGGNVLKMLLGATFGWFDGDDDDQQDGNT